jgi:hypothetical protein
VRLTITETPVFREALNRGQQVKVPMLAVFRDHTRALVAGISVSLATFVLFYLMTVFALSWGTSALHYSRQKFLLMQLFDIIFFAIFIPISAILAERGRRRVMLWVTAGIALFGLVLAPMFAAGTTGALLMMALGLSLMGRSARSFPSSSRRRFVTRVALWPLALPGSWAHRWRRTLPPGWPGPMVSNTSGTTSRPPRS